MIAADFSWPSVSARPRREAAFRERPPSLPRQQAGRAQFFSNQKWDRLRESHAQDIVGTWPDGHETKGIDKHIDDLKAVFVYAPDITIKTHPIRFGSGTFTGVTGVMTGTFTKPMPVGDGKFVQPTGKHFALSMATIGHWSGKTMDHEWLFWDNKDFMTQIGVGQ